MKGDRTTRQESREESKFSLMHACYRGRSQRRRVLRLRRGGRARWVLAGTLRQYLFVVLVYCYPVVEIDSKLYRIKRLYRQDKWTRKQQEQNKR